MQEQSSPNFAERLSRSMKRAGCKQSRLAEMAGVSKGYVSELLSGAKESPSLESAKKFAAVLGVLPKWLATGDGPMTNSDSYLWMLSKVKQITTDLFPNDLARAEQLSDRIIESLTPCIDFKSDEPHSNSGTDWKKRAEVAEETLSKLGLEMAEWTQKISSLTNGVGPNGA